MTFQAETTELHLGVIAEVDAFTDILGGLSLVNMRKVDDVVNAMLKLCKALKASAQNGEKTANSVRGLKVKPGRFIDEDGHLVDGLDSAIMHLEKHFAEFKGSKPPPQLRSAMSDAQYSVFQSVYEDFVATLEQSIEMSKELRASLIAYDLAAESRDGKKYSSARKMVEAILA